MDNSQILELIQQIHSMQHPQSIKSVEKGNSTYLLEKLGEAIGCIEVVSYTYSFDMSKINEHKILINQPNNSTATSETYSRFSTKYELK